MSSTTSTDAGRLTLDEAKQASAGAAVMFAHSVEEAPERWTKNTDSDKGAARWTNSEGSWLTSAQLAHGGARKPTAEEERAEDAAQDAAADADADQRGPAPVRTTTTEEAVARKRARKTRGAVVTGADVLSAMQKGAATTPTKTRDEKRQEALERAQEQMDAATEQESAKTSQKRVCVLHGCNETATTTRVLVGSARHVCGRHA